MATPMNKPKYETEAEVTTAVANREIDGFQALEAYKQAQLWQKYLKTLQPKFFRKADPNKRVVWLNNRPGYASKKEED